PVSTNMFVARSQRNTLSCTPDASLYRTMNSAAPSACKSIGRLSGKVAFAGKPDPVPVSIRRLPSGDTAPAAFRVPRRGYTGLSASFVPPSVYTRSSEPSPSRSATCINGARDPDVLTICVPSAVVLKNGTAGGLYQANCFAFKQLPLGPHLVTDANRLRPEFPVV